MSESDTTYQGWKNYPTWAVNMWLSNDEGLYHETQFITSATFDGAKSDENVVNGIWTVEDAAKYRLADHLKEWVTDDLAPDLGATFAADLLGYALGLVDWDEIASAWLADVEVEA